LVAALLGLGIGAGLVWWLRPDHAPALADAERALAEAEAAGRASADQVQVLREDAARDRATLAAYRDQETALTRELATLAERNRALADQLAAGESQRASQAEQFRLLAGEVLETATARLTQASQEKLDPLLAPLRERIGEFQKKIEETYTAEARERISLTKEIELTLKTSQQVGAQADALARALKGQSQLRGQMGETMLERVLQAAGLQPGISYVLQGKGLDLRDEAGGLLKPDAIVTLPDNKCIVIDSKLALNDYAAWAAAEDDQLRAASLSAFVAAVRGHVAELAGKKYQDNEKLQAPDFVLMYMPFEHALATAMQADPDLFALAWRQRVAIVGPNTLVVTMGVVARIWQYETNRQNAQKIADEAAKLLDQAAEFAHALDDIEAGLRKALDAHADAKKRVFTGNNNILRQAGKLKALGVRNRKAMPASLLRDDALPGPEQEEAAGDPPPG
jgi:DNA recombination protein RmuC